MLIDLICDRFSYCEMIIARFLIAVVPLSIGLNAFAQEKIEKITPYEKNVFRFPTHGQPLIMADFWEGQGHLWLAYCISCNTYSHLYGR